MEKQSKLFAVIVVAVALVALAVIFQPAVEEQLAPVPHAAWVAIEVAGSGLADVGPAELAVGTAFELHAVLEARDRSDRPVYYTEAPRLAFAGVEVPAESLRAWKRPRPVKVRWFTVEGRRPFMALLSDNIGAFEVQEFLRSDWPLSWSVPGEIDAANDNHLSTDSPETPHFGTQRYHVRIELYRDEESLIPLEVIRSWGISDLKQEIDRFPTVSVTLAGPAGPASRVFGLTQLEPPPGAGPEILQQIEELADHHIAFSRLTLLRDQIRGAGRRPADLEWVDVDLAGEIRWGEQAAAGDLVRVGDRVIVLYEDRGTPGVLDYADLCFDFVQGMSIVALDDVFIGSGTTVELASLASAAP